MGLKKVTEDLTVVYDSMNIRVVSGLTGSGKSTYVVNKALEEVSKGESVLFVNSEEALERNEKIINEVNKLSKNSKFYQLKSDMVNLEGIMDTAVKLNANYVVIDPLNLVKGANCNMNSGSSPAIKELETLAAKHNVYVVCTLQEKLSISK